MTHKCHHSLLRPFSEISTQFRVYPIANDSAGTFRILILTVQLLEIRHVYKNT